MPSVVLPVISGGFNLLSGNAYSGAGADKPAGKVRIYADQRNSGYVYVALSGGCTALSGSLSTASLTDGVQLIPGGNLEIPKLAFPYTQSGIYGVWCQPDAACSGTARVFWETFALFLALHSTFSFLYQ